MSLFMRSLPLLLFWNVPTHIFVKVIEVINETLIQHSAGFFSAANINNSDT